MRPFDAHFDEQYAQLPFICNNIQHVSQINYSLGIAAMSFGQDVMSGVIRLYPITFYIRQYQAAYAVMVLVSSLCLCAEGSLGL